MNDDWVVLVPFWAVWPFETMVIPKFHARRFTDIDKCQMANLACAIKVLTTKYDNLFEVSFPYSMGWHGEISLNLYVLLLLFFFGLKLFIERWFYKQLGFGNKCM